MSKIETEITAVETLSAEDREDLLVGLAIALEGAAREAIVEGNQHFAALSKGMAEAIRVNADELAYDDAVNASRVAGEASQLLSKFRAEHPHRIVSYALN
jgi:hypothetical protein